MWAFGAVVLDELSEHRLEVPLVADDETVEALVPEGPHDALRDRVRAGCPYRAEQGPDTQPPSPRHEVVTAGGVPVAQHVPQLSAPTGWPR